MFALVLPVRLQVKSWIKGDTFPAYSDIFDCAHAEGKETLTGQTVRNEVPDTGANVAARDAFEDESIRLNALPSGKRTSWTRGIAGGENIEPSCLQHSQADCFEEGRRHCGTVPRGPVD